MISMDSSNMHMASLTGTKVVSIWGLRIPQLVSEPGCSPANIRYVYHMNTCNAGLVLYMAKVNADGRITLV